MAMRAIMKKISPLGVASTQGLRVPPRWFRSVADHAVDVGHMCSLEELIKDGSKVRKRTYYEWCEEIQYDKDATDRRWQNWVHWSHQLWKDKNEEEQRREIHMRWRYLKDLLNRQGIDTSRHRQLLSMKVVDSKTTFEFKIGSPDGGFVSINRLVLDRPCYDLPRQTVNGLLCFHTRMNDAFIIYNPATGEKTSPWVETNKPGNIAFGFNPESGEHKVICISSNSDSEQVVEVFSVGENTWRRIDAVPPVTVGREVPFYVDGCLYWRFRGPQTWGILEGEPELLLGFDIVTEKFRVIPIPDFVVDSGRRKFSQTVELTEMDRRIAVLDWICEVQIALSTMHEDADGNIEWTKEIIDMPPHWNGKPDISIEALTGTHLIFLNYECSDIIFYYNRNTKESIRFPISPDRPVFVDERIMQL